MGGSKGNLGDGADPYGRVTLAPDGTLYGTTFWGGGSLGCDRAGCGTVFHLTPSHGALAPWNETVLYRFTGGSDGGHPQGDLVLDQSGKIYGTVQAGGTYGYGLIYELTLSGGSWTQSVLYSFQNNGDGAFPNGGVVFDRSGSVYGVTYGGGPYGYGTVYQLSPSGLSWTEQVLHGFNCGDGGYVSGGLIIDSSGNLYGTTEFCGSGGGGTVLELTPARGSWTFNPLYAFSGTFGPSDKLFMDAAGNLYGTTFQDGAYGNGAVFKLTPSGGAWTYTSLHDFTGASDGAWPMCNIVFDSSGNLYGTTVLGGTNGLGVAFEITPN